MFAKVFASLWQGTLYGLGNPQLVFIYLLAHADAEGHADIHPRCIAMDCGMSEADVRAAIEFLEAPDQESRSQESDGVRLERIDAHRPWGWKITNYLKYRAMRDERERTKQNREAQARFKSKQRSARVSQGKPRSAQEEGEVEAEGEVEVVKTFGGDPPSPPVNDVDPGVDSETQVTAKEAFREEFWPRYPRKVAREAAQKAFLKIVKDDDDNLMDEIMRGLEWYIAHEWYGREKDKITHASTWLNQRRWTDAKEKG